MKVSLNIVREMIDAPLPSTPELVSMINAQLGGVEEVVELADRYKDARIVQVRSLYKHPDAERLTVCLIDDGGVDHQVDRDANGLVQVVCGAPNVTEGMWAVWLPPQSIVPSTYLDAEPFELSSRKLRGVVSYGMLAAGDELGINDDHEGIVAIQEFDLPAGKHLAVGDSFAVTFGLDDTIIDIENKMFTHRPDCFGQVGVAREIAAIVQQASSVHDTAKQLFRAPEWYRRQSAAFVRRSAAHLHVFNDTLAMSPRFMAVVVQGVEVSKSPLWLQCRLVALGARPINSVVDATNYCMLMSAQPTHAYDYDKLQGQTIGVRMARSGESITLINGKTYQLHEEDIVVADAKKPVGLAGVMGGSDSEVDMDTKNIVIEVANFDMYTVRKTSMRHGLFTDAVTRFNKGQSPLQTSLVMYHLLGAITGSQASEVYDLTTDEIEGGLTAIHPSVEISAGFINERLGSHLQTSEIESILQSVEFEVQSVDDAEGTLRVSAPFWRTDIEQSEDVVEEVGRLYGFDALPRKLPVRQVQTVAKNHSRQTKQKVRSSLSRMGASEVLTYSFVHQNILEKAKQDPTRVFRLSNALSPDLQYYRLSVLPSVLDNVRLNVKAGHDEFMLFEIGKGHDKIIPAGSDGLPSEQEYADMVYVKKTPGEGAPYYYMRTAIAQLASDIGFEAVFRSITEVVDDPAIAPFEQSRSAVIETKAGEYVGVVGELKYDVRRGFKLPDAIAAATLDMKKLIKLSSDRVSKYVPLSKFPSVERDVCFEVSTAIDYQQIHEAIESAADETVGVRITTWLIDIYQPPRQDDTKRCTFHFSLSPTDKTLGGVEVAAIIDSIVARVVQRVDATVV